MSTASIIASYYSDQELKALQKSIFPGIIMDLSREFLDSKAARQVNQILSEVAFKESVVKEQNLPTIPPFCGIGNFKEAQLAS